jgi:4-hydroxyphenylpyruvate dioxygenase
MTDVLGIHHLELYVSNNYQAAHFCRAALGFQIVGKTPSESQSDQSSITVKRAGIRLVLTSPLTPSSAVAEHIRIHGDGIKDIALEVTNLDELFERATRSGARSIKEPGGGGTIRTACIGACGDTVHTLVEPCQHSTVVRDSYVEGLPPLAADHALVDIDHLALALNAGELDMWTAFYVDGLSFRETHQQDVSTEYSAMRSKVVQCKNGNVRFPMMEPAPGEKRSQIENYLHSHQGPGVQHVAFRSTDIVSSVSTMSSAGVEFLPTPNEYYQRLENRVGPLLNRLTLERLGILVDRDPTGVLLQIFTKPIGPRTTLFLEVVERQGAEGFGSGNIRALFEAVERSEASGV